LKFNYFFIKKEEEKEITRTNVFSYLLNQVAPLDRTGTVRFGFLPNAKYPKIMRRVEIFASEISLNDSAHISISPEPSGDHKIFKNHANARPESRDICIRGFS